MHILESRHDDRLKNSVINYSNCWRYKTFGLPRPVGFQARVSIGEQSLWLNQHFCLVLFLHPNLKINILVLVAVNVLTLAYLLCLIKIAHANVS